MLYTVYWYESNTNYKQKYYGYVKACSDREAYQIAFKLLPDTAIVSLLKYNRQVHHSSAILKKIGNQIIAQKSDIMQSQYKGIDKPII